jgi:signal transduction histidine kinase
MSKLSDEDLLKELADRVDEKNRALFDLRMTTRRLEEVNRRLIESEALKGHFLSNIRNEINNPLAAIVAMAGEIAGGNAREPAECRTLAAAVQAEAFSLDFQLRNIFRAAEIEAGDALPMPARVDLRAVVDATVGSFAPQAAQKGLVVRTDWDIAPGLDDEFTTDPAMLQQILANLVSNAVKFSHGGGEVRVGVRRAAEELRLGVEDRGIGIDPADHGAVFERFRQLESGLAKGYAGQGLGLSVVKGLVELLGGRIVIDSAVGRGSRFTASIPETRTTGTEDVFADAGNEFFFNA